MYTDFLFQNIGRHISITQDEEKDLLAVCKIKKIKKKDYLLREGDVQYYIFFVITGCLRSYSLNENGYEHILQFAPPGWWITDMQSLLKQEPASLNIDAVDDTEIIMIQKTDMDILYTKIPALERFFRILAERALATHQHRLIDALSLPAMERYANFCKRYPTLISQLPQKYVASYIGITPEFLSKMLKQPVKK